MMMKKNQFVFKLIFGVQEEEEDHKEEHSQEEDLNKPQFESIFPIQ